MAPPPSTPAPRRFLVPKRSATQRNDTPKPLGGGSQQFHATPRFALHSTPREPAGSLPSSTPARPNAFLRQRQTESISDVLDSSPPEPRPSKTFSDSIEVESSMPPSSAVVASSSSSSSSSNGFPIYASDTEEAAPSPKRRRLSVSPSVEDEFASPEAEDTDMIEEVHTKEEPMEEAQSSSQSAGDSPAPAPPAVSAQQPVFHRAPRFMPVEQQDGPVRDPLPDIFSPRRRGIKDVPGGLASEVRDWLMDIEASTGSKRDGDFMTKVSVDELRFGTSMVLVKGRTVMDDDSAGQQQKEGNGPSVRIMLAGEGRLLGLARRNDVRVGSLVAIAKPVWEVSLGAEGKWAVACDWVVL